MRPKDIVDIVADFIEAIRPLAPEESCRHRVVLEEPARIGEIKLTVLHAPVDEEAEGECRLGIRCSIAREDECEVRVRGDR